MLGINTDYMGLSQYKLYTNKLKGMPLWVKQAIYSELREDLHRSTDIRLFDLIEKNIIQLYIPKLTYQGKKLVDTQEKFALLNYEKKTLLSGVCKKLNLLEIAHLNNWSLKQCCNVVLELIDEEIIQTFEAFFYMNFILFITGKINIGEFLVRTNRLTNDQLERVLCAKKCAGDFNVEITFDEILVNLGYLTSKDIENVYRLKESADLKVHVIDESEIYNQEIMSLQDEIDSLAFENKKLFEKIAEQKKIIDEMNSSNFELMKQVEKYTKGFVGRLFASLS